MRPCNRPIGTLLPKAEFNFSLNVLLKGKTTKKERTRILEDLKNGSIDLLIGTHAVLESDVQFANLGLVITDEQHRFGVNQRSIFQNKGKLSDVLYMSATPIPRTFHSNVERFEHFRYVEIMLSGENFRRGQKSTLITRTKIA
mgnify:CR=1 FL=1